MMAEFDHEGDAGDAPVGEIEFSSYAGFQYGGTGILQRINGDFEGVLDSIRSWGLAASEWAAYVLPIRHQGVEYQFFGFCTFLRDRAERTGYVAVGAAFRAEAQLDDRALERLWDVLITRKEVGGDRPFSTEVVLSASSAQSVVAASVGKARPMTLVVDARQGEPSRNILDFLSVARFIPNWRPAATGFIVTNARSAAGARLNAAQMSALMERMPAAEREVKQAISRQRVLLGKLFERAQASLERARDRRVLELEREIADTKRDATQALDELAKRGRTLHGKLKKLSAQLESSDALRRAQAVRNSSVLAEADAFERELRRAVEGAASAKPRGRLAISVDPSEKEAEPPQLSQTVEGPALPSPPVSVRRSSPPQSAKSPSEAEDGDDASDILRALGLALAALAGGALLVAAFMIIVEKFVSDFRFNEWLG